MYIENEKFNDHHFYYALHTKMEASIARMMLPFAIAAA